MKKLIFALLLITGSMQALNTLETCLLVGLGSAALSSFLGYQLCAWQHNTNCADKDDQLLESYETLTRRSHQAYADTIALVTKMQNPLALTENELKEVGAHLKSKGAIGSFLEEAKIKQKKIRELHTQLHQRARQLSKDPEKEDLTHFFEKAQDTMGSLLGQITTVIQLVEVHFASLELDILLEKFNHRYDEEKKLFGASAEILTQCILKHGYYYHAQYPLIGYLYQLMADKQGLEALMHQTDTSSPLYQQGSIFCSLFDHLLLLISQYPLYNKQLKAYKQEMQMKESEDRAYYYQQKVLEIEQQRISSEKALQSELASVADDIKRIKTDVNHLFWRVPYRY